MKNDGKRLSVDINKQLFALLDQNETVESTCPNLNELKDEAEEEFPLETCWKDIITELRKRILICYNEYKIHRLTITVYLRK